MALLWHKLVKLPTYRDVGDFLKKKKEKKDEKKCKSVENAN